MPYRNPPEFRRRGLDLVASRRSVASLSKDLGVSDQTIYKWRRQDLIDRGLEQARPERQNPGLALPPAHQTGTPQPHNTPLPYRNNPAPQPQPTTNELRAKLRATPALVALARNLKPPGHSLARTGW